MQRPVPSPALLDPPQPVVQGLRYRDPPVVRRRARDGELALGQGAERDVGAELLGEGGGRVCCLEGGAEVDVLRMMVLSVSLKRPTSDVGRAEGGATRRSSGAEHR